MSLDNFTRMIRLAEEFFATKDDPDQLSIDESVMESLHSIHPATMGEERDDNGPVAWTIVIPVSAGTMERFIRKELNEQGLMEESIRTQHFDAVYLCSALVLPEHRGKGLAKKLLCHSIQTIREQHPIVSLFYWGFSPEGAALANAVARECSLPLYRRPDQYSHL